MTPLIAAIVVLPALTIAGLVWWGWDSWRTNERVIRDAEKKWRKP